MLVDVAALLGDAAVLGDDRVELAQLGERQRGSLRDEAGAFLLPRQEPIDVHRAAFALGELGAGLWRDLCRGALQLAVVDAAGGGPDRQLVGPWGTMERKVPLRAPTLFYRLAATGPNARKHWAFGAPPAFVLSALLASGREASRGAYRGAGAGHIRVPDLVEKAP